MLLQEIKCLAEKGFEKKLKKELRENLRRKLELQFRLERSWHINLSRICEHL